MPRRRPVGKFDDDNCVDRSATHRNPRTGDRWILEIEAMGVTWFWFWVEQEFRGLGVATKLMSKAVAYLKSRG
ncbi:GNAT family N-acetyltransferase [Rhizobium sp. RHZ02]|nr:GNAT family N-acetyltransferase [Rhizobium sp. RHZ02]